MNLIELSRALHQLRLGGMVAVLETRLLQAQTENMAPIDVLSTLVSDEIDCRSKRLLERRQKQARFRDPDKRLDNFNFQFNPKMNRNLIFELATAGWVERREDALFKGPPGTGKSHLAQAIGHAVIQQGYRVLYRETHILLEELADATLDGDRKEHMEQLATVPLLIIDDLGMRKLPLTAAEELLEIIMRRYERASTLITSNRPVDDWASCWAIAPPLPPCSIAYCTTDTCSSADRAVGAPKPPAMRKDNDKNKSNKDAGQRTPGGVANSDPGPPTPEPHHRNLGQKHETLRHLARKRNSRGPRSPIPPEPAPCPRP